MLKQKDKSKKYNFKFIAAVAVIVLGIASSSFYTTLVHADKFDEKIQALQKQNNANQSASERLADQANSYEDAINKLDSQITSIQNAIAKNEKQSKELQDKIEAQQKELEHQKEVLGKSIRAMYLEGDTSTIEILASSNDLSDFVNREEYRSSVQDKVTSTMDKIKDLKAKLEQDQADLKDLIAAQKSERADLASAEAQQRQMLSYTESQKAAYDHKIKTNLSKISALRAQQAAENAKLFGGATVILGASCDKSHGDTYPSPWCSHSQDSMVDTWGMFNRECVSYTAWKVYESGRRMPYWGGRGNANQWDDNARAAGIPVSTNPRAGDVAIKNSLPYGHAMYVESVNSNGTINISQYNQQLTGQFSRAYNVSAAGLVFIHFR